MGNGKEEFLWPTDMGIKVASELAECQLTLELEAPEEAKVKLPRKGGNRRIHLRGVLDSGRAWRLTRI